MTSSSLYGITKNIYNFETDIIVKEKGLLTTAPFTTFKTFKVKAVVLEKQMTHKTNQLL